MSNTFPASTIFESFTYPFFDFNYKLDHQKFSESFLTTKDPDSKGKRGLYIHIPFCDDICNFCPFIKKGNSGSQINDYMESLYNEVRYISNTARSSSMTFDAVYIGGGTPSVMSNKQIEKLFSMIHDLFNLRTNVEFTFEVEAKSANKDTLYTAAKFGATRISFGIQSMDDNLRKIVNLTASDKQIIDTINIGKGLFSDVNADVIVGFPGQNLESSKKDVDIIANLGATSVSLYPMDYVTVMPKLLDRMRGGRLQFPALIDERWEMFHSARNILKEYYNEQNMYCFGIDDLAPCQYMFSILYGGYDDQYIGIGCGAYTSLKGGMFHNTTSIEDYTKSWREHKPHVERSSAYQAYEKSLVYFPKRLSLDLSGLPNLPAIYKEKIKYLESEALIRKEGTSIYLTEKGKLQYHNIMVGFLSEQQRFLYDSICQRLSNDLGIEPDGNIIQSEVKTKVKGLGVNIMLKNKSTIK